MLVLFLVAGSDAFGFFNPQLGRWISRDPIGERGFELFGTEKNKSRTVQADLYTFLQNNPISQVDKLGLDRWHGDQLHTFVVVEVWDDEGKEVIGYKGIEFRADYCKCQTWLTAFLYAPGVVEIFDVDGPPSYALKWRIPSSAAADKYLLDWAEEMQRRPPRYNFIGQNCRYFSAEAQAIGIKETAP